MAKKSAAPASLKLQYLFYSIGVVFLFATIVYFSYEYVLDLSNLAKTIILCCFIVMSFFAATMLEERGI